MKPVNIGLLGLGTVGGGTAAVLQDNAAEISRRLGREVRISAVCDLSEEKARQICPSAAFVKDPFELVAREDVDVVVELFGGTGIAKETVLKAIENGKHIVTANKKLLAEYGNEIFPLAEEKNVMVQFEAAVAGGIPIIKALREGLAANRIRSIAGIINATGAITWIVAPVSATALYGWVPLSPFLVALCLVGLSCSCSWWLLRRLDVASRARD